MWRVTNNSKSTDFIAEIVIQNQERLNDLAEKEQIFIFGERVDNGVFVSMLKITGHAKNNFTRVQCSIATGISSDGQDFTTDVFLRVIGEFFASLL